MIKASRILDLSIISKFLPKDEQENTKINNKMTLYFDTFHKLPCLRKIWHRHTHTHKHSQCKQPFNPQIQIKARINSSIQHCSVSHPKYLRFRTCILLGDFLTFNTTFIKYLSQHLTNILITLELW